MCEDGVRRGETDLFVVIERGSWSRLPKKSRWKKMGKVLMCHTTNSKEKQVQFKGKETK